MDKQVGIFSFFSGAGFLDLGFEHTEAYEILFVNEFHKPFLEIYKASRATLGIKAPKYGYHNCDIAEFLSNSGLKKLIEYISDAKRTHKFIGFIGGPPCPDFSVGGKNKGKEGENGKLSKTYVELICNAQPDFFLFENVKGLYRTIKHREFFETLKNQLTHAGYSLTEKLINSIEYGVPQDRERIILIGFKSHHINEYSIKIDDFNWDLNKKHNKLDVFNLDWPKQDNFIEDSTRLYNNKLPLELTVEYWFKENQVYSHSNANHYFQPRAGLEKFKIISEGDDLKKSYKRLHRWRYSPTAAYGNNEVHLHPYKARRLSVAEALAIQSLPRNYVIPNDISLSNMFKAIGNGVPYLASKALASSIYDFISKLISGENSYAQINCKQPSTFHK
jgi:DNA (cytosine-5)-methyltransferase 1